MRLNLKKYFEEAKKLGLEPYQVSYSVSTEASVEVFNGEVEQQQIGTAQDIGAKGIFEGKQGSFATDAIDNLTPAFMANKVLESAKFGKEANADDYFKGGKKYKKAKTALKEFKPATLKELREFALELCKEVKSRDPRLDKVSIDVTMQTSESMKANSYGMKCSDKMTYFFGYISIVAQDEKGEPRSGGKSFNSPKSLEDLRKHALEAIDEAIHSAVDFFGTGPCKSKTYKTVLSRSSFGSLLGFFLGQLNAKSVQKHLSLFEGKKGSQIVSKLLTMKNMPHVTSPSASSYDADGYPTLDFTFIKNGVLEDYFYSVETANVENRESNGCSSGNGNGSPTLVVVKPGKHDLDSLFAKIKNGLYITSVSGLNSGINGQTLDFSLPCEGYIIKDGKKEGALSMMVMAGNLQNLFNSVIAVGNDIDPEQARFIPSIAVKGLAVSGK